MHKKKIFYSLLVFLILSTSVWIWADWIIIGGKNREYKKRIDIFNQRFTELENVSETYPELKKMYDIKISDFDSLKVKIPNIDVYVLGLEMIRNLAEKQNVKIISLSPDLSDTYPAIKNHLKFTGKHIERYTGQVQLQGDFLSIGTFLTELLTLPMTINIGKIRIESELSKGEDLSCELVVYTYIFFDKVKTQT